LKLMPYERFRPETEAYGQWQTNAPAGTVTDDTRHKMVLITALRDAQANARLPLTQQDLARAYLQFADAPAIVSRPQYRDLCEESFREFAKAAHWVLGNRHLEQAAPPDRIWGGVPTCCGQMTMLPLAALYAGRPEDAYRATYELSFFDVGPAKDINAALVAGLSVALVQPKPTNEQSRQAVWHNITTAMRTTDPYQYDQIPFVTRPIVQWLDFASEVARDATDRPKRLYERLLRDGQVQYFWESHFIVALVFSTLEFCNYDPLAALAMILDFGHDTDSGAQLLGALAGAIHGPNLFAQELQKPVLAQLDADYDVSLEEWVALLDEVGKA
ncbi:MAG: ADP-ribosylglycohydrolase family protein, partial [Planctomycetota bacterium]